MIMNVYVNFIQNNLFASYRKFHPWRFIEYLASTKLTEYDYFLLPISKHREISDMASSAERDIYKNPERFFVPKFKLKLTYVVYGILIFLILFYIFIKFYSNSIIMRIIHLLTNFFIKSKRFFLNYTKLNLIYFMSFPIFNFSRWL